MKIEGSKTFALNEVVLQKNIIVPASDADNVTKEFIQIYQGERFNNLEREERKSVEIITIAFCTIGENEKWAQIVKEIKKDGWSPASLVLWSLYVQHKREPIKDTVALYGTLYRDEDYIEWIPFVRYRQRFILRNATEVSLKLSSAVTFAKTRTVLISKIETTKT